MPLTKAQCPNCGAALEVDSSTEAAICPYCKTPYIVEKAINNYITNVTNNITAGTVIMQNSKQYRNLKVYLYTANEFSFYDYSLLIDDKKVGGFSTEEDGNFKVGSYRIDQETHTVAIEWKRFSGSTHSETVGVIFIENGSDDVYLFYQDKNNPVVCTTESEIQSKINLLEMERQKIITENEEQKKPISKKRGCYIATCVYGSYDCPEVWTLRRYRDDKLAKTWAGRAFIRTYYAISPTLVKWFGKTKWFKKLWKGKLDKMVKNLKEEGFEDTPYNDKQW